MIRWVDAFLDRPAGTLGAAVDFWSSVTGSTPEPQEDPAFVRLRTSAGDDWLEIQEVRDGPGGTHPDLWVDDFADFVARAKSVGAQITDEHDGSWLTLRSPAGLPFCVAAWRGRQRVRPGPYTSPQGLVSRPHQICFDLPPSAFEGEVAFWTALTGWDLELGELGEFRRLQPAPPIPVRFLLQRINEERPAGAHLDVSCADRPAGRAWHEQNGATFEGEWPHWTTLRDPAGAVYCLTAGDPYAD